MCSARKVVITLASILPKMGDGVVRQSCRRLFATGADLAASDLNRDVQPTYLVASFCLHQKWPSAAVRFRADGNTHQCFAQLSKLIPSPDAADFHSIMSETPKRLLGNETSDFQAVANVRSALAAGEVCCNVQVGQLRECILYSELILKI